MTEEQFTMAGRLLAVAVTVKSNILRQTAEVCAVDGVQQARGFISGAWYVKGTAMHLEWKAACEILGMEVKG